ncbi:MAG: SDR family NAD(P)-dependent oxidoreductase [Prevotella sp.]|nr:SDR family NAD(P)-dependent oxidoreductase [Prevotella sp.]
MKRAIVIGASSGIGREVAKLLLQQGWTLGVAARRVELLDSICGEVDMKGNIGDGVDKPDYIGSGVVVEQIDVTAADATEKLRSLIERLGDMDLFFYASGIGKQNRELQEDIELRTMETNALGFTRMIGEAYRYFAKRSKRQKAERGEGGQTGDGDSYVGHIAAITSIAGTKGLGPAPSYSATKAMQNVYLQALEQQANARGLKIRFTDIRPGFVDTALLSGDFRYPMMLRPERVAREIVSAINRRRHIRVIDWRYRLLTALWRRIPRFIWRHIKL